MQRLFSKINLFRNKALASLFFLVCMGLCEQLSASDVQLASVYQNEDVREYLVSEKYDGIRAIWKNGELRTRAGNIINAPEWFIQYLPHVWLDGELWIARQKFEELTSTVSKHKPNQAQWKHVKYMVFDAPNHADVFSQRAKYYSQLITKLSKSHSINHVVAVEQFTVQSNQALSQLLEQYTKAGAEGLMLHKASAKYEAGRNKNVLKLKPYMDAEAKVIEIISGKGKYASSMGALLVETLNADGKQVQFRIGTGFTDAQRDNPPPIGSIITYQFHGYTRHGKPKFASFLRRKN